jgi:WD40 repeat protein
MTTASPEAPPQGQEAAPHPERPDVFVSYSRKDQDFVHRLVAALEAREKDVWVDWDDIRKTADWRAKIASGVESSRTVLAVLSPDFAASEVCDEELQHAVSQNKRLIPVLRRELNGAKVREELTAPNWIFFRERDDFEHSLDELIDAIETDLEWLDAHARLLVRATEWERAGRNSSFLLRGSDLHAAESWLGQQGSHLERATPLQGEYIVASRRATQRRQRITFGAVLVALVLTAILAALAWLQRNEAVANERTARSRELSAAAVAQLDTDPELSVVLARDAVNVKRTAQSEQVLRRALSEARVLAKTAPHGGWVTSASFSPDGKRILTASRDGTARLSDSAGGRTLAVLRGHSKSLAYAEYSADGSRIATASGDGTARVWDADGQPVAHLRGHRGRISQARFSSDGTRVVTSGIDATARIWDAQTGRQLVVLTGHRKWITRALFVTDGIVATGSDDGTARLWDATSGETLATLPGGGGPVLALAASRDGKLLATGTGDLDFGLSPRAVRIWDASTGRPLHELEGHLGTIASLAFSPDGSRLVSVGADGTARVWDTKNGAALQTLTGGGDLFTAVAYSSDGTLLAGGSSDGTVRIWDERGTPVLELNGHGGWITSVSFDRTGERLLTAGADRTARVWDVAPARKHLRLAPSLVTQARFSPDGTKIATTGFPAAVWSTTTGRRLAELEFGGGVVAWSPDGKRVAAATQSGPVGIYDAATGRLLAALRGHETSLNDVQFSRDGSLVVTAGNDLTARVWNAATGAAVAVLRGHTKPVKRARFNPEGTLVVTASEDGTARLWAAKSGRLVRVLRHVVGFVNDVSFSPDGKTIASGGSDATLRLWDSAGRRIDELRGHSLGIVDLAFSADGRLIVTASSDHSVAIWDARNHLLLGHLIHPKDVLAVAVSGDGRYVVTGSSDGIVRVWEVATRTEIARFWGNPSYVSDVDIDPSGRLVSAGGVDVKVDPSGVVVPTLKEFPLQVYECIACQSLDRLLAYSNARFPRTLTPAERTTYLHEASAR